MRIRTVEYEPGWGWIARDPRTGKEVIHDFRWSSRAIARQVVSGVRPLCAAPQPVARKPLTGEQIQDLLLCGDPTDEEMRLIRIGWDAANGIKGGQHGTE